MDAYFGNLVWKTGLQASFTLKLSETNSPRQS